VQGIYAITNTVTGEQYVGRSRRIYRRWAQHARLLSEGKHPSARFNRAWTEHGPTAFAWQILQLVPDAQQLAHVEHEHVERLHPAYNLIRAFAAPKSAQKHTLPLGWLSVSEVAVQLNRTEDDVRNLLLSGELRGWRIGQGRWRVREHDLQTFLDRHWNAPSQPSEGE
jgi:group I intron endonuclease